MRRGVVFDVDGTLVDSNYLHCVAWVRAFRENGHDVPASAVHRCVGMGADDLLRRLLGRVDERVDAAHSRHYAELYDDLRALPGAADLLRELRRRGAEVVLATSAKPDEVEVLLRVIAAPDAVGEVTSSADVEQAKPDPEVFRTALESAGLDAAHALAVGDTVWDVEAARRAGLGCVGVLTGGIAREELLRAGALAVFDGPDELLARLDESPLGALLAG